MKEIKSKYVKESLLDYATLANSLKESTSSAVRDLLSETVRETFNQILTEDEDEFDVEEVEDTESVDTNDAEESTDDEATEEVEDSEESFEDESDEAEDEEVADEVDVEATEATDEVSDESEDDEWADFDQYKVADGEYDFSQAEDDEIVKVYKLLKDTDQVLVNVDNDNNKVEIKDNETGAEYLIDVSSMFGGNTDNEEFDMDGEADGDLDFETEDMTNESRIFEVVLNEYDSNVGYTTKYQKKDVMTTPSMEEPGKNVNDWDAGVPRKQSWGKKGSSKPFEKKVNEEEIENVEEQPIEETRGGYVRANSTAKFHDDTNPNAPKARNASSGGVKVKGTSTPRYSTNEAKAMMNKVNKILKENEELKLALGKFKNVLQEAAVTNVNLGQIIKLISENSTTKDEKQEIIARFGKEAKTIEQSKALYESISRDLKKNNTMNLEEGKQFTANSSKMINETQIYQSKDLLDSLDLMHRICR